MTITITKFKRDRQDERAEIQLLTLYLDKLYQFDLVEVMDVSKDGVLLENLQYVKLIFHWEIEIKTYLNLDN